MLMLHELQDRFAASVVDADPVRTAGAIVDDPPGAAARLGVYINHFQVTLTDVLETTFPVVRQLVGDPFFRMVARHYVRDAPPRHPCLFQYGGGFPGFLERLPEVRSLPYLADVARLEWAINEAWHARRCTGNRCGDRGRANGGLRRCQPSPASVMPTDRVGVPRALDLADSPEGLQRTRNG